MHQLGRRQKWVWHVYDGYETHEDIMIDLFAKRERQMQPMIPKAFAPHNHHSF